MSEDYEITPERFSALQDECIAAQQQAIAATQATIKIADRVAELEAQLEAARAEVAKRDKQVEALREALRRARGLIRRASSFVWCCNERHNRGDDHNWDIGIYNSLHNFEADMFAQAALDATEPKGKECEETSILDMPPINITNGMDSVEYVRRIRAGELMPWDNGGEPDEGYTKWLSQHPTALDATKPEPGLDSDGHCNRCGLVPFEDESHECPPGFLDATEPAPLKTIPSLLFEHIPWSRDTFGDGLRTGGITKHIRKELEEILEHPTDLTEWCDVIILALDGAWRAGHSPEDIERALASKLEIIRTRTYPKPTSEDEPSEHVRSSHAPAPCPECERLREAITKIDKSLALVLKPGSPAGYNTIVAIKGIATAALRPDEDDTP